MSGNGAEAGTFFTHAGGAGVAIQCGMTTVQKIAQGLPADSEIVGFDGDVAYLRSASQNVVFIAQGATVWSIPMTPQNDAPADEDQSEAPSGFLSALRRFVERVTVRAAA
jgi:hypothetical protein